MTTVTPLLLVSELRSKINADLTKADVGGVLRSIILEASQWLTTFCKRRFDERIETRYYTAAFPSMGGSVAGMDLQLDADLKAVTTLTNGDGSVITTGYTLFPRMSDENGITAYQRVRLSAVGGNYWSSGANDWEGAISLAGTWGYGGEWIATGGTLNGAQNDSATTFTASAAMLEAGMMLKIDSEYQYVTEVSGTTVTVQRGQHGSTAAAHSNGAAILRWSAMPLVQSLVSRMVLWKLQQNQSPLAGQVVIGDIAFPVSTDGLPKDLIQTILGGRLRRLTMPGGV